MKISDNGLAFITGEEGERLVGYADTRGIPTIGVGHTGWVNGLPVSVGMHITHEQSAELLRQDLANVEQHIHHRVTALLNQHQYDALCSLVFNIGTEAFSRSTVLQKLNTSDYLAAADSMLMWCRAGNEPQRLLPRRQRERTLFMHTETV